MAHESEERAWMERVRAYTANPPRYRAPAAAWATIQARIERGETVLLPVDDAVLAPPRITRFAFAAGVALLLVGGAAALMRIEVLRTWTSRGAQTADTTIVGPRNPTLPVATITLVVTPDAGRLAIALVRPDTALLVRVRIVDRAELEMTAKGEVASARFRTGPGSLTVTEGGAGELVLMLPRTARHVSVQIDGRVVFLKEANEVRVLVPADTSGAEFIFSAGK